MLGDTCEEGDDVVLCLSLDLVDAINIESALLPDRLCSFLWNDAKFRHGIAGVRFDLEPNLELVLGLPNASHFGAAITWDHRMFVS